MAKFTPNERLKQYQQVVDEAVKAQKVFMIVGGFPTLRNALLNRGWVEKLAPNANTLPRNDLTTLLNDTSRDNESAILSRLLDNKPVNFFWKPKVYKHNLLLDVGAFVSRIVRSATYDFTTKEGLQNVIEIAHWHQIENFSEVNAPRTYSLATPELRKEFVAEFRLTACLNLIHFLSTQSKSDDYFSETGTVATDVVTFAIERIEEAIKKNEMLESEASDTATGVWDTKLSQFQDVSRGRVKIGPVTVDDTQKLMTTVKKTTAKALKMWPWLSNDGVHNIWIVKPMYQSCGRGITLHDTEKSILTLVEKRKFKYIAQKYMENPLLIYNTKFDIRQYFIMSVSTSKLVKLWLYKDCYLRFSSQEFSLDKLSADVHLTNHFVQKNYRNAERDGRLPVSNMWSLAEFLYFLKTIDKFDVWDEIIYPGMKRNIRTIVMASLDETEIAANTFQLFGVDFMIESGSFKPILIEVNSSPDLRPTTHVTKKICAEVLEDLIKVIVDNDPNPGEFECIFEVAMPRVSKFAYNLVVSGKKCQLQYPQDSVAVGAKRKGSAAKVEMIEAKKKSQPTAPKPRTSSGMKPLKIQRSIMRIQVRQKPPNVTQKAFANRFATPIQPVVVEESMQQWPVKTVNTTSSRVQIVDFLVPITQIKKDFGDQDKKLGKESFLAKIMTSVRNRFKS